MIENSEILIVVWDVLKEYIPAKEMQAAADHLFQSLIDDAGLDEDILIEFAKTDKFTKSAMKNYLDLDSDESDIVHVDDDDED